MRHYSVIRSPYSIFDLHSFPEFIPTPTPPEVRELTGDASMSKAQMDETNVIVTTPEKYS